MESTPGMRRPPDGTTSTTAPGTADLSPEGNVSADGSQQWVLIGVTPDPGRVPQVRHEAHKVLHAWALDDLGWAVELLLTELAGNVVRHARTPYDLTMSWDRHTLRVSVHDGSPDPLRPRVHVSESDSHGRGLLLVTRLATRWGCEADDDGKAVWFELVPPVELPNIAQGRRRLDRFSGV